MSIHPTGAMIALCAGVVLVAALRFVESHAASSAAKKTGRLLDAHSRARDTGEPSADD